MTPLIVVPMHTETTKPLPPIGTVCIAEFSGKSQFGQGKYLVEIKGFDDDAVWMLVAKTHYSTELRNNVTLTPAEKEVLAGRSHIEHIEHIEPDHEPLGYTCQREIMRYKNGGSSQFHILKNSGDSYEYTTPVYLHPQPAPAAVNGLKFLSAKDGSNYPKFGAKCLIKIKGVLQHMVYELNQGDSDFGGGDAYWDHGTSDECPLFDFESDQWLPLSAISSRSQQGDDI